MKLKNILSMNIIKFSCSSFVSFLADYAVYSLISLLLTDKVSFSSITFANICARIVSSSLNFTINRKLVFRSNSNASKSAFQFFTLAATVLVCNSLVLNFLTHIADINHYIAKIMTEMFFFIFNFSIQNFVIFKDKNKKN